jgi:DNA replication licensing factor MCM3
MSDTFRHERQAWFREFIHPNSGEGYAKKVEEMTMEGKNRFVINLSDIRERSPEEYKHIITRPMDCLPAYEAALKTYIDNNSELDPKLGFFDQYHVSVEGPFGSHRMGPRQVMAANLTQMVCVEGIVIKASIVRPKIVKSVHYCEVTKAFSQMSYRDGTDFSEAGRTGSVFPTHDADKNPLTTEFGLCEFRNHQKVYIQDMPERTEAGTMPRTLEVIVENDLVDSCKPGDRVQMIGVYRAMAGRAQGSATGRFRTLLIANNVRRIGIDERKRDLTPEDVQNFRQLIKRKDLFDLVSRSIAPCIYGHDYIKKAITLMLLGGVEKNLDNGTHIRGDVNILMVGDPSTAKSQMLRAVMNIGHLVINTTGRGSSGVGLTAAVTGDKDTGEKRLEAGAMVLADRGIVTIDEFDKMTDADRTAIHEVMEQQTVTIAKAGIHTSLNARCSVLAASNPIYGQYDSNLPPAQNIALPDSLLSRFDLLFIVLDRLNPRIDRAISEHVLRMHMFEHKAADPLDGMVDQNEQDEAHRTEMFETNEKLFGAAAKLRRGDKREPYLTSEFVKKFVNYAKAKAEKNIPVLTNDAREMIAEKYAALRQEDTTQTLPITPRSLETFIRLASAHAKLRVDTKITEEDVEAVAKVMMFALTNDAVQTGDQVMRTPRTGPSQPSQDIDALDVDMDGASQQPLKRKKPDSHVTPEKIKSSRTQASFASREAAMAELDDEKEPLPVNKEAVKLFKSSLTQHFKTNRTQMVSKEEFWALLKAKQEFTQMSREQYEAILQYLHEENRIFLQGKDIHRL